MTINAIQTEYEGCLFRSRLEARWAVFFDYLRIKWQYEPQGFEVGFAPEYLRRYLPDFFLPDLGIWVEVKGDNSTMDWTLLGDACDLNGLHLPQWSDRHRWECGGCAIVVLGPIPSERHALEHEIVHPFAYSCDIFSGGVHFTYAKFEFKQIEVPFISDHGGGMVGESFFGLSELFFPWHETAHGTYSCLSRQLWMEDGFTIDYKCLPNTVPWSEIQRAYRAARSARFEHGYSGATL